MSGPLVELAQRFRGVDVIVSGHTHQTYVCPDLGGALTTSAGAFGRFLTRIELEVDPVQHRVLSRRATQVPVTHDLAPDARAKSIVDRAVADAAPLANRRVGRLAATLGRSTNEAGESLLGDVVADAHLAATRKTGAAIAFTNPGGLRADLPSGDVTYAETFAAQPFGNTLVTFTLTGAQVAALLEQQWLGSRPRILQPSANVTYAWSVAAPAGSKVVPGSLKVDGRALAPDARVRVTVNSFLGAGGDGFSVLTEGTERVRRSARPRGARRVPPADARRRPAGQAERPAHHAGAVSAVARSSGIPGRCARKGTCIPSVRPDLRLHAEYSVEKRQPRCPAAPLGSAGPRWEASWRVRGFSGQRRFSSPPHVRMTAAGRWVRSGDIRFDERSITGPNVTLTLEDDGTWSHITSSEETRFRFVGAGSRRASSEPRAGWTSSGVRTVSSYEPSWPISNIWTFVTEDGQPIPRNLEVPLYLVAQLGLVGSSSRHPHPRIGAGRGGGEAGLLAHPLRVTGPSGRGLGTRKGAVCPEPRYPAGRAGPARRRPERGLGEPVPSSG